MSPLTSLTQNLSIKSLISQNLHHKALKLSLSSSSSPLITDQIYTHFIKSGHVLDPYLSTSLITHFSKSHDYFRSFNFFLDTIYPDIVSFNALLSGYSQFHHLSPQKARNQYNILGYGDLNPRLDVSDFSTLTTGLRQNGQSLYEGRNQYNILGSGKLNNLTFWLFNKLECFGLRPDRYTLSSLVKSCDSLEKIMIAHVICIKYGFNFSGYVVSGLINKYGKLGFVECAEKCFEECLDLDSVVWTSMINGYVWNYEFDKGKMVFLAMRRLGFGLNEFVLSALIGTLFDVKEGEQIHGFGLKVGLLYGVSINLCNVLMNMYARCGCRLDARKVFDEMPQRDVVSWTVRIGVACDGIEALHDFKYMHLNDLEVNEVTIINVLSAIEDASLSLAGRQVHSFCHKTGFLTVTSVSNALISMYGRFGQMVDARVVFDDMDLHDSVSWNSLIGGYSDCGLVDSTLRVFSRMCDLCIQPDQYTIASVLGAFSGPSFSDTVKEIQSFMIKGGLASDDSMVSCLIFSYGKCYNLDYAKKLLFSIKDINAGHLQVMAATAIAAGCPAVALECCQSLVSSWSTIDSVTLSILLKACSALANLGQGKAFHSLALKSGLCSDMFVETAIVDFYCKSGCVAEAHNIFMNISYHNLAAWNAMIMGYAQRGYYYEVLYLFEKMIESGIKPDEITYLGILQSCSHLGLVNEANIHLNSMFELHGVLPCLEHYASMVDLLGRLGHVEEAKLVIDQMPVSPDAQIWQSFLSACNNSGNLELGEVAARELLKLQPENDSAYILLASLYAKAHNWDAVRSFRKEMKEKLIHKEPGCSWTEIGSSVSCFLAKDMSHPQKENIYFCLQSLARQMLPLSDAEEKLFALVRAL